ncbi:MAG: Unknown protein [uncultured Aureispira sp.]|uniref:Phosphodiester glycosidase domain-containing protein n=1 Tax=uncultured Aureispira sp. TaxID=1331704 RepID=A0A6S6SW24_9BACT|nr:MAG: Unknown protein [uncultured Aureispira sp.]
MINQVFKSEFLILGFCLLILNSCFGSTKKEIAVVEDAPISTLVKDTLISWKGVNYVVITTTSDQLSFFLEAGNKKFRSFSALSEYVRKKNKNLIFAMNGGMYLPERNNEPQGLYIEQGKVRKGIDTFTSIRPIKTNFYLHPNGVFYIKKSGAPLVKKNSDFLLEYPQKQYSDIKFATQSGPMLVTDGAIHPAFTPNSKNVHIRNAVGINDQGEICFVLSEEAICFHAMATLFKEQLNCENALYLDGFVSKLYYPKLEPYRRLNGGNFGVIIGLLN